MYVFVNVSLLAGLRKKTLDQFWQNSVERWHMDHVRNRYILVVIRIMLH